MTSNPRERPIYFLSVTRRSPSTLNYLQVCRDDTRNRRRCFVRARTLSCSRFAYRLASLYGVVSKKDLETSACYALRFRINRIYLIHNYRHVRDS